MPLVSIFHSISVRSRSIRDSRRLRFAPRCRVAAVRSKSRFSTSA
jgi:hypothetical protein